MDEWKEGSTEYPNGSIEYHQRWKGVAIWSTDRERWRTTAFAWSKRTWHGTAEEARKRAIRQEIRRGKITISEWTKRIEELRDELR